MKKIAILYPAHYEQSNGGAELQISYFVKAAVEAGHEVHYIYEDNGKPIINELGIALHPLKLIKGFKRFGKGWFRYKKTIKQELYSIHPDVIYTRLYSSWIYFGANYSKHNNAQSVYAVASDYAAEKHIVKLLPKVFDYFENRLIQKGISVTDTILVQNREQQQLLEKNYGKRGVLIHQMTPGVQENTIKKTYDKIRIVWIANMKSIKRPELFVKLASQLSKVSEEIDMVMCGRCPANYKALLDEIKDIPYLNHLGEVSQEEVFQLLNDSHILVNTSDFEGFSNTFVQAWMRKVVVVSMNSNPNDIITSQKIGFVAPQLNLLCDNIMRLITNRGLLQDMADRAYDYAMENHSIEKNMPKLLSLIDNN